MSTERDTLRSKIFKSKKLKTKNIDLFGEKVEVRQPTVGQILEAQEEEDRKKALIDIMVGYCYVPGTEERVFEEGDQSEIMSWPVGTWFTDLNNAITELTDIDVQGAEKNSQASEGV